MVGDWGGEDGLLRDPWPAEPLPPERLPSVAAARAQGWHLAPDAPLWCFLPAVWPARQRAWVPDRSVRVVRTVCDGVPGPEIPWSAWDHAEVEGVVASLLADAGVPARPPGRLWLLRPPPGTRDLDDAVDRLAAGAESAGVPVRCCAELVAWSAATVDGWFRPGA
ncbi:DUF5956 family protein [Cellulomonas sp. NS3]|uniref:DUF5956 family protein n=1 Tax=Cellulomonas sp. NS3 TaxID=2973977 RepID=UPI0021614FB3|nr:DUF5956 family protein [Cellulomonas sp. NS3]